MSHPISEAKASVSLLSFLVAHLGDPRMVGGEPRWNNCPACGEAGQSENKLTLSGGGKYWRCFRCGGHGDVVAAAAAIFGCSDLEAAKHLLNKDDYRRPVSASSHIHIPTMADAEAKRHACATATTLLLEGLEDHWDDTVASYLTQRRGFSAEIVHEAWRSGLLRMLPADASDAISALNHICGQSLLVEAGIWKPDARAPAMAFRPCLFVLPSADSFEARIIRDGRPGEPKVLRYGRAAKPWFWGQSDRMVAFCEGAIDMLSLVELGYEGSVVGFPGCNSWRDEWLAYAEGKKAHVVFDNDPGDNPGQRWAQRLTEMLGSIAKEVINKAPPPGQDINDLLRQRRKAA